jgi:hypothetical protein
VINWCKKKITPASDTFVSNQKLSPVEEAILVEYSVKCYNQGFLLRICNLNDFANKLLRNRDSTERVGVNWHLAFFRRYPEIEIKYSRPIDKQRIRAENSDEFIK